MNTPIGVPSGWEIVAARYGGYVSAWLDVPRLIMPWMMQSCYADWRVCE